MLGIFKIKSTSTGGILFIKLIIWFLPILLLIFIVNKNFSINGIFNVVYKVEDKSEIVKKFASKESYKLIGSLSPNVDYFQYITTTPVYFDVNLPRLFSKATVTLKYKNPNNQPVIRLGVKQKNGGYVYRDMAITSNEINSLPDYWNKIEEGNVTLWQKDIEYYNKKVEKYYELNQWYDALVSKINEEYQGNYLTPIKENELNEKIDEVEFEYNSKLIKINNDLLEFKSDIVSFDTIENFQNNFPDTNEILKYNYDFSSKIELKNYTASDEKTIINKSIRGSHEIYTYIGSGEELDFIFTIQDANRHVGEDILSIKIYNSLGQIVDEVKSSDDGDAYASGQIIPERRHQLLIKDLPFGTYRLVVSIPDDDIFIKKIESKQHLLMFRGNIYLTDNIEYSGFISEDNFFPSTIYTDSTFINARTSHENGLQVLRVGSENLVINEKHEMFGMDLHEGITPIISPKNDIYIEGDGFFTFSKDHFFDANYNSVKNIGAVDNISDYNYIIVDLPEVEKDGAWLIAKAEIEVPYLYITEGKSKVASFIIDLPGLPENNRNLLINQVSIQFEKNPLSYESVVNKIKSLLNKE